MSSPQRSATKEKTTPQSKQVSYLDFNIENERLRTDNENLLNILNGLNEKLNVFNDLKSDVKLSHQNTETSESARA